MQKVNFEKIVGSGNDFLIVEMNNAKDAWLKELTKAACHRKYGFGADGILVLERVSGADVRMRIFNADGSEAEMCGNGARCTAFYVAQRKKTAGMKRVSIQTRSGRVESWVRGFDVGIQLTRPKSLACAIPLKIGQRQIKVNFIDTGVPHTVIFVEGLDKMDVDSLGRAVRFHKRFAPRGTNVNFVEVQGHDSIRVRTYERGVEAETLACGTGSVASSLVAARCFGTGPAGIIKVQVASGETLTVRFEDTAEGFKNVWLAGPVRLVGKGEYYV